jgi:hypothetical protein
MDKIELFELSSLEPFFRKDERKFENISIIGVGARQTVRNRKDAGRENPWGSKLLVELLEAR